MSHRHFSHQKILEHLNSAVLLFDHGLNFVYANPAAEDLFRISCRKFLGCNAVDLIICPEEDIHAVFERALLTQQPITERELLVRLNSRVITVNSTITPIVEAQQLLLELVQVDQQLRITKEAHLIQHNKVTREVVCGLAHEINNPLSGIRGAAQLLERAAAPELHEYTQVIIQESDRLSKLLNQLLGPTQPTKPEWLNIHEVLDRVCNVMMVGAPKTVRLHRDYDPSIPLLQGDHDQLIQVFMNIVKNALQALGQQGDIRIKSRVLRQITIGQKRHRLVIKVDISDNGPGIERDMLEKIFYPMVTGRSQGTGIGLSIAQALINHWQGLIECQSQPGNTLFSVLLPLGR